MIISYCFNINNNYGNKYYIKNNNTINDYAIWMTLFFILFYFTLIKMIKGEINQNNKENKSQKFNVILSLLND